MNLEEQMYYRGKVRDVYRLPDNMVMMVTTNRVSAHDHVFEEEIPGKGAILNTLAFNNLLSIQEAGIASVWVSQLVHPNITIGRWCEPLKIEIIVRRYLEGSAWRKYRDGARSIYGVKLPEGLKRGDRLPKPIITPTTKAENGEHDEDISGYDAVIAGLITEEQWEHIKIVAPKVFQYGSVQCAQQGLILVDTKYEFGIDAETGILTLIDEVHTPDSSRFYHAQGYEERQKAGEPQRQLSKEFLREWLAEQGFTGAVGQTPPVLTKEIIAEVSQRYQELYETVTGSVPEIPEGPDADLDAVVSRLLKAYE